MGKQRSESYRMRQAINDASNRHDRAFLCDDSMRFIAEKYKVDLTKLKNMTLAQVQEDDDFEDWRAERED